MTNLEKELQTAIDRDTLIRILVELDALKKEDMILVFGEYEVEISKNEIKKYLNEEYATVRVSKKDEEEVNVRYIGVYLDEVIGGFEAYEKASKPVAKKRMGWSNHSNFTTGGDASSCHGCAGGPCGECKFVEQK